MEDELLLIAHRGYSGDAPEDTFAAFDLAIARGWNHIEFDVQLSRDGVPVIMHDLTLDRTTNGRGALADQTLRDLQQLDAGSWFEPQFASERIPTLSELLRRYQAAHLHMELKSRDPELAAAIARLVEFQPIGPPLVISSEWTEQLERIRPLVTQPAHYEVISRGNGQNDFTWAVGFGARGFSAYGGDITPELVSEARQHGLEIGAWWWTREEQDASPLRMAGARYAFVDSPALHSLQA